MVLGGSVASVANGLEPKKKISKSGQSGYSRITALTVTVTTNKNDSFFVSRHVAESLVIPHLKLCMLDGHRILLETRSSFASDPKCHPNLTCVVFSVAKLFW